MSCVVKSRASSVVQVLRFEYKDAPRVSPTFAFKEITEFLYDQGHRSLCCTRGALEYFRVQRMCQVSHNTVESIISSFLPQKKARNVLNIDRRLIHLSGVKAFF
jgi:hypothetical protein